MKKKVMIELGLIVVMAVALVFSSASLVMRKNKPSPRVPGKSAPAKEAVKPPMEGLGFLRQGIKIKPMKDDNFYVKFCRIADSLPLDRDPFAYTGAGPKSSRDGLDLTGILWDAEKPTAVINNVFYSAGDSTDQFTVTAIDEDSVFLKDAAGDFELRLKV